MNYEKFNVKITEGYYLGRWGYTAEVTHDGLKENKILVYRDSDMLNRKINILAEKWDNRWKKLCEKNEKEKLIKNLEEKTAIKNYDAKFFLEETRNILHKTLEIDNRVDWDLLKNQSKFDEGISKRPELPEKPRISRKPRMPRKPELLEKPKRNSISLKQELELPKLTDEKYKLNLSFRDRIFKSRITKKKDNIKVLFQKDVEEINELNKRIKVENERSIKNEEVALQERIEKWENDYEKKLKKWEDDCEKKLKKWENNYEKKVKKWKDECQRITDEHNKESEKINNQRKLFYEEQKKANELIDIFREEYFKLKTEAIEQYCSLVLSNSNYPTSFPQSFEIEYSKKNKSLIVDYRLPSLDDLPIIKEVKFVKTKKEIKEVLLSKTEINKLFDNTLYQICLRTIHELFEADTVNAIEIITFNGFVNFINKSNGKEENSCLISLQTSKEEFLSINLSKVDPKECFKGLKGIGSSKLYGLSPIKPIIMMDRIDSRIAESYSVVGDLDDTVNLAKMNWEDFENLVREIFAKEFTNEGAEVHVTQASRDGGVDAIAFDPDPIRGGKIVIQAKRYTNVVSVSAVRDLYGTVVNEGAIKGILVTTADYGPDAYKFAKDKPLLLMNGNNLLHMLMKHGIKAKIDINEAKKYFKENS